jgi:hypothetical protein
LNTRETAHFLVLLPHRDSRNIIEDCRKKLFAAGFIGAYSFPSAAPVALLSGPLSRGELKQTALEIRNSTLQKEGKISASGTGMAVCPEKPFANTVFCGPFLGIPQSLTALANEKTLYAFPDAVLCAAIGSKDEQITLPEFPSFSFRAAMVANLVIRRLKSSASPYSLEWQLGPGCWLPNKSGEQKDFC